MLARCLHQAEENVAVLDSNADAIKNSEEDGLRAVFGNALEERTLFRAQTDTMTGVVGLTPNEEVNLLFLTKVHRDFPGPALYIALHRNKGHVTDEMIEHIGARTLFGMERDVDLWSVRLERGLAACERWRWEGEKEQAGRLTDPEALAENDGAGRAVLPLVAHADGRAFPVDGRWREARGVEVDLLIFTEADEVARAWLRASGWTPAALVEADISA